MKQSFYAGGHFHHYHLGGSIVDISVLSQQSHQYQQQEQQQQQQKQKQQQQPR